MSNLYVDNIKANSNWTGTEIAGNTVSPTGSILQVTQALKTDIFTTTGGTQGGATRDYGKFQLVPGLSGVMTPRSANNKILCDLSVSIGAYYLCYGIVRCNGTIIAKGDRTGTHREGVTFQTCGPVTWSGEFTDCTANTKILYSPNTTSECVFTLEVAGYSNSFEVSVNGHDIGGTNGDESAYPCNPVSTMTLFEIAG
tara:strand:- start:426 stop:1019 length:594 start_codon:yes stop_codon:yes gene_type:complete